MKPYFGNKYLSESEKQAKAIVDQRAAEGFKDPPVIMTGAAKTYMKFVLGAEQDDKGEWSRLDTHVNRSDIDEHAFAFGRGFESATGKEIIYAVACVVL